MTKPKETIELTNNIIDVPGGEGCNCVFGLSLALRRAKNILKTKG